MPDLTAEDRAFVDSLVGDQPAGWDVAGELPDDVLRKLGTRGLLCAQVPTAHGGIGASSRSNGEFTAHVGSLCSSLRSVMTSQGMAAWTVQKLGDSAQRAAHLRRLTGGQLAAVCFSEPAAGSDLAAMGTTIRRVGDSVVVDGHKKWATAAAYADLLVVFGRYEDGAAAVVVPTSAPGVRVERVIDPLGCRAAGHAHVRLDDVRLPADSLLGGVAQGLPLLVTTALAYGRFSVAWGCVGILRACRTAAAEHASTRQQFGRPIAEHQLVARHLAELYIAEQTASRVCEHASDCWDAGSPEVVVATVLAKHVAAGNAARGAGSAVQVLASAAATDGHVVARAYRDAKLMEIIEGSSEICQLILAEHATSVR
ncbi:methoxymalonate biosynthesis protein [Micromonospora sp. ATCC 39149]|uniref:Acyl-CoA dehydrogenase family protein n=1 Tax=Micromonospora carbonacea TaxID=47853 RepID=A0A7D5Y4T2_9ACTN|nr:acyl-CoA dehydrogenase family protein [Micromonospora sp. ATCC 39149]EEP70232.1 methoxymalonate biosynthesis protein [Micromonospora sp. ATCC 39149]QLJ96658.1 acyl-CoA dehydrogenase family protein [Micromonospora carbonacea]